MKQSLFILAVRPGNTCLAIAVVALLGVAAPPSARAADQLISQQAPGPQPGVPANTDDDTAINPAEPDFTTSVCRRRCACRSSKARLPFDAPVCAPVERRLGRPRGRPLRPRAAGYRPGVNHGSVAVEKRAGGHMFQLNVSGSFATTMGQIARGGPASNDWFLGFNISRKFF
jgi:hypothetical protein